MTTLELLKTFCCTRCAPGKCSHDLTEPFTAGDYSLASSHTIIVRVARIDGVPPHPTLKTLKNLFAEVQRGEFLPLDMKFKVDSDPCGKCAATGLKTEMKPCKKCDGDGECVHCGEDCRDCGGLGLVKTGQPTNEPCENCAGSGKIEKSTRVNWGETTFDARLLTKLQSLPGIKLVAGAIPADRDLACPFIFEGGDGLIMPLRIN